MSYRAVSIRSSARRARGHAGSRAVQWSCSPSAVGANAEAYPGLPSAPGGSGLLGPHSCSRLVVPFAVDGVNLRLLLWPFSSVSLTFCAGIVTISLFFFLRGSGGGVCISGVLTCLESVRKLPCQLKLLRSHAV